MAIPITQFDQATWLAKRVTDARRMGPPKVPEAVALPGARTAIPSDRLEAYHQAGHDEHEIVARTNARWRQENAGRLNAHREWTDRYTVALEEMKRRAAEAAAEELRKRTAFERFMSEHDSEE